MSRKIRFAAAALIVALLAGGVANALPGGGRIALASPEPTGAFAPLWSWFVGLFAPAGDLTAVWGEEGAEMDPNGTPADAGVEMDPNGSSADAGPEMDPNGAPQAR